MPIRSLSRGLGRDHSITPPRNMRGLIEALEQRRLLCGGPGGDPGDPGTGGPGGTGPVVNFDFPDGTVMDEEAETVLAVRASKGGAHLNEEVTITFRAIPVTKHPVTGVDLDGAEAADYQLSTLTVTIESGENFSDPFTITAKYDELAEPESTAEGIDASEYLALEITSVNNANFSHTLPDHAISAPLSISDGTWWYLDGWKNVDAPAPPMDQELFAWTNPEGTMHYVFTKTYEMRYLGAPFLARSDDWGERADMTSARLTWTDTRTIGTSVDAGITVGGIFNIGGSYSENRSFAQGGSVGIPEGISPETPNVMYQIAGYAEYAYIRQDAWPVEGYPSSEPTSTTLHDLGYTGELNGEYTDMIRRDWLDPDDPETAGKTRATTSVPAPPSPPAKLRLAPAGSNPTYHDTDFDGDDSAWIELIAEG